MGGEPGHPCPRVPSFPRFSYSSPLYITRFHVNFQWFSADDCLGSDYCFTSDYILQICHIHHISHWWISTLLLFTWSQIDDLMGPSSFMIHRPYDIDTISILDISMTLHQYLSLPNTNALSPHFCANDLIAHHYLSPRFVISLIYVHLSLPDRILDILRFSCLLRTRFYFISGWKSTTRYVDMYLLSPSAEHFCAHESTDVAEDGVDLCLKG